MDKITAIKILREWDKKGKYVFTKKDLKKIFHTESERAFSTGLARLSKSNILNGACRGIYVNPDASCRDGYTIEHIAVALRRGHYSYVSLESMLSEYGIISQILMDRITIMTTGRKGIIRTRYGVIEYTHTKRSEANIRKGTIKMEGRPLWIASRETAWRDLKRVGRNVELVDLYEMNRQLEDLRNA